MYSRWVKYSLVETPWLIGCGKWKSQASNSGSTSRGAHLQSQIGQVKWWSYKTLTTPFLPISGSCRLLSHLLCDFCCSLTANRGKRIQLFDIVTSELANFWHGWRIFAKVNHRSPDPINFVFEIKCYSFQKSKCRVLWWKLKFQATWNQFWLDCLGLVSGFHRILQCCPEFSISSSKEKM